MGMAHHPDFPREPYIYIMYTYREGGDIFNKVVRLKDGVETGSMDKTIIDKIPGGNYHDGGRIKFGPDGKLYITTGEIYQRNLAQSLDSLGGKILRLNPDGSVPRDNPFKNSPIFSYGHRNPQGIDWHPETRDLFSSEHGPSGEMAQHAHDEVNVIRKGKNYGWPEVIGAPGRDPYVDPLVCWKETTPPAGVAFWKGDFYVTTLRSRALIRIGVDQTPDGYEVKYIHRWFARDYDEGKLGRLRNVVVGPDNALYLMSSNRDGRGDPRPGDDQIYRITFKD
jgi:quinoprotein glucose dehydrogenase